MLSKAVILLSFNLIKSVVNMVPGSGAVTRRSLMAPKDFHF